MYLEEACKLVESDSELFLGLCDNLFDESSPDLSNSVKNAENFISSEICDREDFVDELKDDVFGKNGLFVCALAGRSTGKSFIIYELAKSETFQKNILVVDTREPKDILSGLVYAPRLNQFYWVPFFTYDIVKGNAQLISEAVDIFVKLPELLKTYGPTFFRRFTDMVKMTAQ